MTETGLVTTENIERTSIVLRGHRVILDSKLATLDGVTASYSNEAVNAEDQAKGPRNDCLDRNRCRQHRHRKCRHLRPLGPRFTRSFWRLSRRVSPDR
jgi:hypothetical protein